MKTQRYVLSILMFLLFFLSFPVFAGNKTYLTYQGRILKSDGSPVSGASVSMTVQIVAPTGCLLWEQNVGPVDFSNSKGTFTVTVGNGANTAAGALAWDQVFQNGVALGGGALTGCGGTYNGAATDDRTLYMVFNDGSGNQTVGPVAIKTTTNNSMLAGFPFNGVPTNGQTMAFDGTNSYWYPYTPAGGGSLNSVALSAPAMFSIAGSPVTGAGGTITLSLANQTANTIFAGPSSGGPAAPTFRSLAPADLTPALPAQATHAGKYLQTDGAGNLSWQTAGGAESTTVSNLGTGSQIYKDMTGAQINIRSILGTANQVTAAQNANDITLSLPQDIATTSTPTFATPTAAGHAVIKSYADANLAGKAVPAPTALEDTKSIRWNNGGNTWEYYTPATGTMGGSGTAGKLPKFSAASTLADSIVTESGTDIQIAGQVQVGDGTAAAPSLSFTADTNTGVFRPGADIFAISTAGTERMRVDASGNVGIGTASPTAAFQVDAVGQAIVVNSPSSGSGPGISLKNDTGLGTYISTGGSAEAWHPNSMRVWSNGAHIFANNQYGDGTIKFYPFNVGFYNDNYPTVTFNPTGIGIGTPLPATDLHVRRLPAVWGSPTTIPVITLENSTNTIATGDVRFDLINGDANKWSWLFSGSGSSALKLQYNSTDKITFASNGNVGIGATPTATLHVAGTMRYVDGNQGAGKVLQSDASGNATWATLGGSESTAVSNVGAGGVGMYRDMTGSTINLKNINAASSAITVTNDPGNSEIDIGVNAELGGLSGLATTGFVKRTGAGAYSTASIDLTTDITGILPIANGGTNASTATAGFNNLSPLTTKGDIVVHNGTNNIRLPVGTDNYVLTADSAQASGVKWAAVPSGESTTVSNLGTGSQIYKDMTGAQINIRSILGTANQVTAAQNANDITLSLPQDIATTSTPTFATPTVAGHAVIKSYADANLAGKAVPAPTALEDTKSIRWNNGGNTWEYYTPVSGSGTVNSGTQNQLAWYSANGTAVSGLATANNGVLVTDGTGAPSVGTALPNAVQDNITRLGTVTNGTWNGTAIGAAYGGTGQTTYTAGDILYASGATALTRLPAGTSGYVLKSNGAGTAPSWQTDSGGGSSCVTPAKTHGQVHINGTCGGSGLGAALYQCWNGAHVSIGCTYNGT